tara:strand:- start:4156 stop:4410 length:255 start_codon:yes stop_codon:yes gene_type:complete
MILRSKLSRAASWLFHNDPQNKARFEIYDILSCYGLHPRTKVNAILTPELEKTIDKITETIKAEETKEKERQRKAILRRHRRKR